MTTARGWLSGIAGTTIGLLLISSADAFAGGYAQKGSAQDLWLSCEDGRNYPIRAAAISEDGDLVTGYLVTGKSHGVHLRLIPMGDGYRYAGPGIWFDGLRGNAVLYWGRSAAVNCTVSVAQ
jgi:hypothetical protein